MPDRPFNSLYAHGFARVSVCIPKLKVASPAFNVEQHVTLAREADADGSTLTLFPELGLSAYSNDDLFHQDALLDASLEALESVVKLRKSSSIHVRGLADAANAPKLPGKTA